MPVTHPLLKPPTNAWAPYTEYANRKYASPSQCLVNVYPPNNGWNKCPTVLAVHGGGWSGGSRTDNLLLFLPLIRRGFAVASLDYRLSGVAKWPAQSVDIAACSRWLLNNAATYRLWNGGLFLWGGSAGGHLTALAATLPRIQRYTGSPAPDLTAKPLMACVDYAPLDLGEWLAGPSDVDHDGMVDGLLGLPRTDAKLDEASPITHAASDNSPMVIRHGDADTAVPTAQSQAFYNRVLAAGGRASFEVFPGETHADFDLYSTERMNAVADSFATRLHEVAP